jgi:hypothetical protein
MKVAAFRIIGLFERLGLVALAGLTFYFLETSWRKWPDPLIDFGRECYIPWRLESGALLYRDVDDFYGPLSQYFNAGLFRVFGPGLMVLVAANLLIYLAIVVLLYVLFRRAWGVGAAFSAVACFVSIFSFSHFVVGSYNYATPYAHEATHGFLVCLLLVQALLQWMENTTIARSAMVGGLLGLTAVLKPEIAFAAGLVTASAFLIHWKNVRTRFTKQLLVGIVAALTPTLAFAIYFSIFETWGTALTMACRAWLSVISSTRYIGDIVQSGFVGMNEPWPNFLAHMQATITALMIIGIISGAAFLSERVARPLARFSLGLATFILVAWLAIFEIRWINVGRCLLGLSLIYASLCAISLIARAPLLKADKATSARLLIAILAVGMMARMLLNGRIYQFGFYQAAMAGMLVPAVFFGEIMERFKSRWGRAFLTSGGILLFLPGAIMLAGSSQRILRLKNLPVGSEIDRFYAFPPEIEPTGQIVQLISEQLRQTPEGQTVLVLPEGEMVNYLARRASPVAPFFFFSAATSGGREQGIVEQLGKNPPDWVVIISRDLREYGVRRYGETIGQGKMIMQWVDANYRFFGKVGGDPLSADQRGGVILQRRRQL